MAHREARQPGPGRHATAVTSSPALAGGVEAETVEAALQHIALYPADVAQVGPQVRAPGSGHAEASRGVPPHDQIVLAKPDRAGGAGGNAGGSSQGKPAPRQQDRPSGRAVTLALCPST